MKKLHSFLLFQGFLALSFVMHAEVPDDTLMVIGGKTIMRTEFERIYHKNNGNLKSAEQTTLSDYLNLFINFKLKVIEAESLGMDTLSGFHNELAGYRDQLAKSYMTNNSVNERLTREAYDRMQWDVFVSHIFVQCDELSSPSDTLKAFTKIEAISKRLAKGESFGALARELSEDPTSSVNEGRLGYITAFQLIYPLGYAFETAAYTTPVGQCSSPFRTKFGYHIVRVGDKIPARGQVNVAHIMKAFPEGSSAGKIEKARLDILALYDSLNKGADFARLATKYSDDGYSARKGGELGWFGTGRMVQEFEEHAFSIKTPGSYCAPFQTRFGWHIIRLLDKKGIPAYEAAKPDIEKMIPRDERGSLTKQQLESDLCKEYGYTAYPENLRVFYTLVDSSFFKQGWKKDQAPELKLPLFKFGNSEVNQNDFRDYLISHRITVKQPSAITYVNNQYRDFRTQYVFNYAKDRLETKYDEFRDLMQEYHDGILLFDLTDKMVWTKALKDSAGLQAFYEANKMQYIWGPGVNASIYRCSDPSIVKKARSLAQKRMKNNMNAETFIHTLCPKDTAGSCLKITDGNYEKGDEPLIDSLQWKKGISETIIQEGRPVFVVINALLPTRPRQLNECRGLVTASYQDYLEKEWIHSLRQKYPVRINNEILSKVK
jgi:peptidyl-prolyl cis-trans isomerase SurA